MTLATNPQTTDYIIVGAGSAGSALAEQLSKDGRTRVTVIEAGGFIRDPLYGMPLLAARLIEQKRNNWHYTTAPQQHMFGRELFMPRGKMVGGSFGFNGTQFVRGNRYDFDHWRDLGNEGWGYDDVLPYYKEIENSDRDDPEFHGKSGPLPVRRPPVVNPITKACLAACAQAGFPINEDFNGRDQYGFGLYDFNILGGRRATTARMFLYPALKRPNLQIVSHAHVKRVVIENGRAKGVEYTRDGNLDVIYANNEVILCGGTINTPQTLMLSGIGDAEHLRAHGIPVVTHRPGVGKNLQDHLYVMIGYECLKPFSLMQSIRLDRLTLNVLNAYLRGKGPVARSALEAGGFFYSGMDDAAPDIQANFVPLLALNARIWLPGERNIKDSFAGYVWQSRPRSTGEILLRSADHREKPIIDPKFLSDEYDLASTRKGIKEMRRILLQPALDELRGPEMAPSAGAETDSEIDHFIRSNAGTSHHPTSTAKMGNDPMAVVDSRLRVHGVDGLRVADASIMPTVTTGNTNAASILIGYRAAALIKRDSNI